ncbi:MAG: hypothetical protein H0U69_15780 [Trueperaceae bacterium]|nr:hypothetical protein [Trueperaceae bacterium]
MYRARSTATSVVGLALLATLLAACAPAMQEVARPVVLVVAGPTELPLDGVDGAMRSALRRAGFGGSFGPTVIVQVAERRDLSRSQALRTTAELGRIGRADVALFVEVVRLDRHVELERRAVSRRVTIELQLRATLVDPATGAVLWSTRDAVRQAVRTDRTTRVLPPLQADPDAVALRDGAVTALAREVVARLALLDEPADRRP